MRASPASLSTPATTAAAAASPSSSTSAPLSSLSPSLSAQSRVQLQLRLRGGRGVRRQIPTIFPAAVARRTGNSDVRESSRQEIPLFSHLFALRTAQRGLTCGNTWSEFSPNDVNYLHAGKSYYKIYSMYSFPILSLPSPFPLFSALTSLFLFLFSFFLSFFFVPFPFPSLSLTNTNLSL